jgi:hypothetical protein
MLLTGCPYLLQVTTLPVVLPVFADPSHLAKRASFNKHLGESQNPVGEEATAQKEAESSPSSLPFGANTPPSSSTTCTFQECLIVATSSSPDADASWECSDVGVQNPDVSADEKSSSTSQNVYSTQRMCTDPLGRRATMLVHFLLEKYKMKEPVKQADMLKVVSKKYKQDFLEFFRNPESA